ncbi:MAG: transcriptional regulator [Erythrobacter sp.]
MPKLDLDAIEQTNATGYPAPFAAAVRGRWWRRLAPVAGLTRMGAGDVLAWPAGEPNGHHLQNRSDQPFVYAAISAGDAASDEGVYSDIDMTFSPEGYFRKDGTRYDTERLA